MLLIWTKAWNRSNSLHTRAHHILSSHLIYVPYVQPCLYICIICIYIIYIVVQWVHLRGDTHIWFPLLDKYTVCPRSLDNFYKNDRWVYPKHWTRLLEHTVHGVHKHKQSIQVYFLFLNWFILMKNCYTSRCTPFF